MIVYETERLVVRPWTEADADRLYDTYSRWEVARWLGAQPRAMESSDAVPVVLARWRARSVPDPTYGVWAVGRRDTGVVVGTVLLVPLPASDGSPPSDVEVGWHLHPDSWGHGYATEAARGALARGFAAGLTEIFAVVRPGNEPSMAVCRRLGMTPLGLVDRWYGMEAEGFRATSGDHSPEIGPAA